MSAVLFSRLVGSPVSGYLRSDKSLSSAVPEELLGNLAHILRDYWVMAPTQRGERIMWFDR